MYTNTRVELYNNFLGFIDSIFCTHKATNSIKLIGFYTRLLRHWVLVRSSQLQSSAVPDDTEDTIIYYMQHVGSLIVKALRVRDPTQCTQRS